MSNVLVVDDDADIRTLVEFRLTRAGYKVRCEADGEAGIRAAREARPELVILDWMMPTMSGLDVCLALRADRELCTVPVLLLTAKTLEADVEQGLAAGADGYIVKPFSAGELLTGVDAAMRQGSR